MFDLSVVAFDGRWLLVDVADSSESVASRVAGRVISLAHRHRRFVSIDTHEREDVVRIRRFPDLLVS